MTWPFALEMVNILVLNGIDEVIKESWREST